MRIFLDTANLEEIRTAVSWGVIDGVTTNPTLFARENKKFEEWFSEAVRIVGNKEICLEVVANDTESIVMEAESLCELDGMVVPKIPITAEGLKAIKELDKKGIKINATLVFSVNQALLAANAGADYVSIFIGRLDDIGQDGMQVVRDTLAAFDWYGYKTQIIVASIRHTLHIIKALKAGADVVTVPFAVLKMMLYHPLTDIGIAKFNDDWKKRST